MQPDLDREALIAAVTALRQALLHVAETMGVDLDTDISTQALIEVVIDLSDEHQQEYYRWKDTYRRYLDDHGHIPQVPCRNRRSFWHRLASPD